ncbi:hypothetical protein [Lacrimispora indolis]|uniref:hypothetical protein n=1 Tax=Lacrimispora indolis TaxID=69825 RepID=UPI00045EA0FE|nr:hypothetical protein [Lacrimispora indolis]
MRLGRFIPMFEADGGQNGSGGGGAATGANQTPPAGTAQQTTQTAAPAIDYDKIAQPIAGKQAATEDSVLKGYLKQQGLSQEEMSQAIAAFKQQKAASQPDVNAMQTQLAQAQAAAQQAAIDKAATMVAIGLGIDVKTVPYALKMADLTQVIGQDGKINDETMKNALTKVLEDVPALKPQTGQATGFVQVGAPGQGGTTTAIDAELDKIFGVKK